MVARQPSAFFFLVRIPRTDRLGLGRIQLGLECLDLAYENELVEPSLRACGAHEEMTSTIKNHHNIKTRRDESTTKHSYSHDIIRERASHRTRDLRIGARRPPAPSQGAFHTHLTIVALVEGGQHRRFNQMIQLHLGQCLCAWSPTVRNASSLAQMHVSRSLIKSLSSSFPKMARTAQKWRTEKGQTCWNWDRETHPGRSV